MVVKTSDLQNVGRLYWVTAGRMFHVSAIASSVADANHHMHDVGGSAITQTEDCDIVLISDDDKGTKIAFR